MWVKSIFTHLFTSIFHSIRANYLTTFLLRIAQYIEHTTLCFIMFSDTRGTCFIMAKIHNAMVTWVIPSYLPPSDLGFHNAVDMLLQFRALPNAWKPYLRISASLFPKISLYCIRQCSECHLFFFFFIMKGHVNPGIFRPKNKSMNMPHVWPSPVEHDIYSTLDICTETIISHMWTLKLPWD